MPRVPQLSTSDLRAVEIDHVVHVKRLASFRDAELTEHAGHLAAVTRGTIARGRGGVLRRRDAVARPTSLGGTGCVGPDGNDGRCVHESVAMARHHLAALILVDRERRPIESTTGESDFDDAIEMPRR